MTHTTREEFKTTLYGHGVTVPAGSEVRQTTPDECPTERLWYVVDPRVILEIVSDVMLRNDLKYHYVFVPHEIVV